MSKVAQDESRGIELSLSWLPASGGAIPEGAVSAGPDVFVARAKLNDEWLPGKAVTGHENAYVPYAGDEHKVESYQVLVESNCGSFGAGYHWVSASNGETPKRALVAAHVEGAPLFVARAEIEGEMCAGKMLPGHGCAYMPHGGREHKVTDYEVLVFEKP